MGFNLPTSLQVLHKDLKHLQIHLNQKHEKFQFHTNLMTASPGMKHTFLSPSLFTDCLPQTLGTPSVITVM